MRNVLLLVSILPTVNISEIVSITISMKLNQETEIGIMIGDRDYWNQGYGTDIISTLIDYVFSLKKFKRVYLKTLENNYRAQKCFEKCGLTPCGHREQDGYHFLLMDLDIAKWQELKNQNKPA